MCETVFVTATWRGDLHYVRLLIASILHYYPNNKIVVLGDDVDLLEFTRIPNCEVKRSSPPFTGLLTKLSTLFDMESYQSICFCDADSILVGHLLESLPNVDFIAFDGKWLQLPSPENSRLLSRYAFDPEEIINSVAPDFKDENILFFSSGHFIIRKRNDLADLFTRYASVINNDFQKKGPFHFGDQGFLNFAVNYLYQQKHLSITLMHRTLPGRKKEFELVHDISLEKVIKKENTGVSIIHYTGPCRKLLIQHHRYGSILSFFQKKYYSYQPPGLRVKHDMLRYLLFVKKRVDAKWKQLT